MINFVQGASSTVHSAASVAAAFTSANAAGNLILVCVGAWNGGTSPTVSDSAGNTYTQIQTDNSSSGGSVASVWYAQNIKAGANTVTIAGLGGGSDIDLIIAEYSGLSATAALEASSVTVNTTTSVTAAAVTPTQSNGVLLLYGYDQSNSGDTFTFSASPSETFTQRQTTSNTAGGESSALTDSIGSFGSAITPSVSISAGGTHALYLVAILLAEASSGGGFGEQLTLTGAWMVTSTSQTVQAGFGTPTSYVATGLPPGVTLNTSTGALSGAVSASGTYTFTVTATDASGKTASVTVTASITLPVDTSVCAAILPGYAG